MMNTEANESAPNPSDDAAGASARDQEMYGTMKPGRLFIKCAIPGILTSLVWAICSITDGIFVGNQLGADGLAAINVAWPLGMMPPAVIEMISIGANVRIAMSLGRGDEKTARIIYSNAQLAVIVLSLSVTAFMLLFADPLVRMMGAEGAIAEGATEYLQVLAVFALGELMYIGTDNYLRTCGQVRYSLYINIGVAVGNIVLDGLFLVVMGLGIGYAALATCITTTVGAVLLLYPLITKKLVLYAVRGRMSLRSWWAILYNGSSDFFNNLSGCMFMLVGNILLFRVSGDMAVSVFGILMYVNSLMTSVTLGMSGAMSPALSYNHGSGDGVRAGSIARILVVCAMASGLMITAIVMLFNGPLASVFITGDPELQSAAEHSLVIFGVSYLFSWMTTITVSMLTALDRPRASLVLGILSQSLIPILLMIPLSVYGSDGVWWAYSISAMISSAVAAFMLLRVRSEGLFRMHLPVDTSL